MADTRTRVFANNASARLNANLAADSTSLVLEAGAGARFPSPTGGTIAKLVLRDLSTGSYEVVVCTARSSDTLTIERATEGTSAFDFPAASTVVQHTLTADDMEYFQGLPAAGAAAILVESGPGLKTSELVEGDALDGTEIVPVVQAGTTKRVTAQAIANLGGGGGGAFQVLEYGNDSVAFDNSDNDPHTLFATNIPALDGFYGGYLELVFATEQDFCDGSDTMRYLINIGGNTLYVNAFQLGESFGRSGVQVRVRLEYAGVDGGSSRLFVNGIQNIAGYTCGGGTDPTSEVLILRQAVNISRYQSTIEVQVQYNTEGSGEIGGELLSASLRMFAPDGWEPRSFLGLTTFNTAAGYFWTGSDLAGASDVDGEDAGAITMDERPDWLAGIGIGARSDSSGEVQLKLSVQGQPYDGAQHAYFHYLELEDAADTPIATLIPGDATFGVVDEEDGTFTLTWVWPSPEAHAAFYDGGSYATGLKAYFTWDS